MHMQVLPGFKVFETLCLIVCVDIENKYWFVLGIFGYFVEAKDTVGRIQTEK